MKKTFVYTACLALLVSSCGTYEGVGAYTGAQFGSVLGSAVGAISDGHKGSAVGTIVGMAGGAIAGGAIGAAKDRKNKQEVHDRYQQVQQRKAKASQQAQGGYDVYDSGFDSSNSGDDRLYDFNGIDYTGSYSAQQPVMSSVGHLAENRSQRPQVEIRNARFVDANQDRSINRNELCKVIFEIFNRGSSTLYDIQPVVIETTGNKHLYVSPGMHVESLSPGQGIRYTALVKADNRLKAGSARFSLSVAQNGRIISHVSEFNIPTSK